MLQRNHKLQLNVIFKVYPFLIVDQNMDNKIVYLIP